MATTGASNAKGKKPVRRCSVRIDAPLSAPTGTQSRAGPEGGRGRPWETPYSLRAARLPEAMAWAMLKGVSQSPTVYTSKELRASARALFGTMS